MSHLFICSSHLFEVATFEQQVFFKKLDYANAQSSWTNSCNKMSIGSLNSAHQAKRSVKLKDLFGIWTKLKENVFKKKNQINSTVSTRTWVLSTKWTRLWPSTGLVSKWKIGYCPYLLEWSMLLFKMSGCCILHVFFISNSNFEVNVRVA